MAASGLTVSCRNSKQPQQILQEPPLTSQLCMIQWWDRWILLVCNKGMEYTNESH